MNTEIMFAGLFVVTNIVWIWISLWINHTWYEAYKKQGEDNAKLINKLLTENLDSDSAKWR